MIQGVGKEFPKELRYFIRNYLEKCGNKPFIKLFDFGF